MELINNKLIIDLYGEYINDVQNVFYTENNVIIIMKKMTDEFTCICDINPKKYHSDTLKVILMFDIKDPYKLISNLEKYKINEIVKSDYYNSIQDFHVLSQMYYNGGQKLRECHMYIKNNIVYTHGLYQLYSENGQILTECIFIPPKNIHSEIVNNKYWHKVELISGYTLGDIDGIYKEYYISGQIHKICTYDNGILNGIYKEYYESGQIKHIYNYIDGKINGLFTYYYESGQIYIEYPIIHNNPTGVYHSYYENGNIKCECYILNKIRHGVCKEYYENGLLKETNNYINGTVFL